MLQSVWDDIRREFDYGNMVNKLVIINVGVYLAVNIFWVITQLISGLETSASPLYLSFIRFFSATDDWWYLLTHPWTVVTHMFFHQSFWHILGNMLFLFYFGRIFGDLYGDRRVLPLYLTGGLVGFLFFFIVYNLTSLGDGALVTAYGASGAVACILTAIGFLAPEYSIRLMFIGNVRLKYIVLVTILVQIISLGSLNNIGGTIDHIGGIAFGMVFALYLQRGRDLTEPMANLLAWLSKTWTRLTTPSKKQHRGPRSATRGGRASSPQREPATKTRSPFMRKASSSSESGTRKSGGAPNSELSQQEQVDAILDKIKERGYQSLSKDEKDVLFRASNQ